MNVYSQTIAETNKLAELIAARLKILQQVRALTQMQPETIESGDMAKLLNVLAAKERLLTQLRSLESELTPYRDEDPDARVWRSQDARLQCRRMAEQGEALLQEIMNLEKQCESDLVARRDRTAAKIHAAHDASRARTAYAGDVGVRRSLDLTSE